MASEDLMAYMAGQDNNCSGGNGWGGGIDGIIGLAALGLIFGGGNGGLFGGGRGQAATQADLAAGFNNSAVLSSLNDIKLGQASAINYNNQGFSGLNTAIMSGFHGVDNAVCTLGYNMQGGFNSIGHQISDCCCTTQRAIDGVRYDMARESCDTRRAIADVGRDIIDNQNANYRGLMDFMVQSKIDALQSENEALRLSASQAKQNQYLIDQLRPCPVPAYITCNPYAASWGVGYSGGNGCGCGC